MMQKRGFSLLIDAGAYREYRQINFSSYREAGVFLERMTSACLEEDRAYLETLPFIVGIRLQKSPIRSRSISLKVRREVLQCLCWTCNRQKGPNRKAGKPA